jgi:hypothetical protein
MKRLPGFISTIATALTARVSPLRERPPLRAGAHIPQRHKNRSKYSPVRCERARLRGRTDLPGDPYE